MIGLKMNKLKKLIKKFIMKYIIGMHKFPTSVIVHRINNKSSMYEIEFNWYDEDLNPVSIVRDIATQKIFSIRSSEITEFKEYSGKAVIGSNIDGYNK